MTEIQNPKRIYDFDETRFQFFVLVINYCNLRFVCYLVLVYCLLLKRKEIAMEILIKNNFQHRMEAKT